MPAQPGGNVSQQSALSFNNTQIAFQDKSVKELKTSYRIFKIISNPFLSRTGQKLVKWAVRVGLPVTSVIRSTVFKQFCGGEDIAGCEPAIARLANGGVGTILDYSVEGSQDEQSFSRTADEIIRIIKRAQHDERIPLAVFKISGIGRFELLKKVSAGESLTAAERAEWTKLNGRVSMICAAAEHAGVPVMIDAEESWIQPAIDKLATEMMKRFNRDKAVVYNTYQLYLRHKEESLKADIETARHSGYILGAKLVRGAYMEKERARATELGYPSPVYPDKDDTDNAYNKSLQYCIENLQQVALVAGTHNEENCMLLTRLMDLQRINKQHPHVYFAQLLGMADHISFNLAHAGYRVAKYMPYGPVKAVLPYLFRRAEENTSVTGHAKRELSLLSAELKRRKH
ncbi:proline dehydrogenase [Pedobacter sp. BS3]|uniref:proline dehydrogenase family protein n=1 Tax=Pedobacter sp. BS3 TaxID=2567937 RepID=UPI0011EC6F19|nr:proline dehydrogenase family protein [Pedobacter sp. BS3]TZF83742.1 proline dehydrogenase [Pedobacter sp. BS3]